LCHPYITSCYVARGPKFSGVDLYSDNLKECWIQKEAESFKSIIQIRAGVGKLSDSADRYIPRFSNIQDPGETTLEAATATFFETMSARTAGCLRKPFKDIGISINKRLFHEVGLFKN
jgi:hypothetical protein